MKNDAKSQLVSHLPSGQASVNIKIERSKRKWKSKLTSSLFVLPYLVCFIAFLVYPLVHGIIMSFQDYELLSEERHFVGWRNYTDIFKEGNYLHTSFFQGLLGTIKFVVYSVPFLIVIGLALALLVNALPSKVRGVYRTIFFMPYAISASVMAVIFIRVFDTNAGLLNIILGKLHLHSQIGWLTDLPWVWIALVGATLWWTIGFNMLIFINALNEVSEEMYEAAKIDGANTWQRLIHITLPSIRRIMVFVVITTAKTLAIAIRSMDFIYLICIYPSLLFVIRNWMIETAIIITAINNAMADAAPIRCWPNATSNTFISNTVVSEPGPPRVIKNG